MEKGKKTTTAKSFHHIDNLVHALKLAGYRVTYNVYNPVWYDPKNLPKTVISLELNEIDSEGNNYEFLFDAETGKRL